MQVFEFVKLKELYYAGSHGMDIVTSVENSEHTTENVRAMNYDFSKMYCPFYLKF
jgi:trehalose 6-phosphate phosphatase